MNRSLKGIYFLLYPLLFKTLYHGIWEEEEGKGQRQEGRERTKGRKGREGGREREKKELGL